MSNSINFVGNVVADAEIGVSENGTQWLAVKVADNVGYGDRQKTNWFRVSIFGKRASSGLKGLLVKGQQVFVSGELTVNEYTNKEGVLRVSNDVNANIINPVGGKRQAQEQPQPVADEPFSDDIPF